jgi:hypothetical protein
MIHTIVYAYATSATALTSPYHSDPGYKGPKTFDVLATVRNVLEKTHDTFIWIVTTDQLDGFMQKVQKYKLDKYLVVRHDKEGQGTTNRNYPHHPKRLKVFIMKGAVQ